MFPIENQSARLIIIGFSVAAIAPKRYQAHKNEITTAVVPITPEAVFPNFFPKKSVVKKPTSGANNKSNIVVFISELSF
jgi:hypothetical protein